MWLRYYLLEVQTGENDRISGLEDEEAAARMERPRVYERLPASV